MEVIPNIQIIWNLAKIMQIIIKDGGKLKYYKYLFLNNSCIREEITRKIKNILNGNENVTWGFLIRNYGK